MDSAFAGGEVNLSVHFAVKKIIILTAHCPLRSIQDGLTNVLFTSLIRVITISSELRFQNVSNVDKSDFNWRCGLHSKSWWETVVKFVFCSSADYLKNASRLVLAGVARPRALITIKLESRQLLSRDAPRRAEGGRESGARGLQVCYCNLILSVCVCASVRIAACCSFILFLSRFLEFLNVI